MRSVSIEDRQSKDIGSGGKATDLGRDAGKATS
jgi:hypothetical protein